MRGEEVRVTCRLWRMEERETRSAIREESCFRACSLVAVAEAEVEVAVAEEGGRREGSRPSRIHSWSMQ